MSWKHQFHEHRGILTPAMVAVDSSIAWVLGSPALARFPSYFLCPSSPEQHPLLQSPCQESENSSRLEKGQGMLHVLRHESTEALRRAGQRVDLAVEVEVCCRLSSEMSNINAAPHEEYIRDNQPRILLPLSRHGQNTELMDCPENKTHPGTHHVLVRIQGPRPTRVCGCKGLFWDPSGLRCPTSEQLLHTQTPWAAAVCETSISMGSF